MVGAVVSWMHRRVSRSWLDCDVVSPTLPLHAVAARRPSSGGARRRELVFMQAPTTSSVPRGGSLESPRLSVACEALAREARSLHVARVHLLRELQEGGRMPSGHG